MNPLDKKIVGGRIKKLRTSAGYTQVQLGEKLGVDRSSVANYETGKATPPLEVAARLADIFNESMDFIMGRDTNSEFVIREQAAVYGITRNHLVPDEAPIVEMVQIPIYGEIRAGYDSLADQRIIGYGVQPKDEVSDGDYFYLIVRGDSMIDDNIKEGMRVLVKSQRTCEHGKIGVVLVNGDEGTLKRVFYDGDNVILQAANRDIPPRILPFHEVRIQGQVKKVEFDV